jgi:hypothetical protein
MKPFCFSRWFLFGVKEALTTGEGTLNIFTGAFSGALQLQVLLSKKKWFSLWTNWKIGERGFTGYGGQESIDRETSIVALKTKQE